MGARHFGIGIETTWGTAVAPTLFFEALSESIQSEPSVINIKTIRTRSTRKVEEAFKVARGNVEFVANYQDAAHLFYLLLGDVDTTTATSGFQHTVPGTTGVADRPYFTVEVMRDDTALTWRYAGSKINSLAYSVSVEDNQEARFNLGFLAASETTGTSGSPSFPDLDVQLPKHVAVSFDGTTLPAKAFRLNCNFPLDEPAVLGSTVLGREPQDNDTLEIAAEIDVLFENLTQYTKFANFTDIDMQVLVASGGVETMTLNLNKCKLLQATPHVDGRNRLVATYSLLSYFDTTATENLQVVVVNDRTSVP